jgi:tripartite-type tricarboxylate transporter receptor subunit TctC
MFTALSLNAGAWQPEQPVKLYVGGPAGAHGDNIARTIAAGFTKRNVNMVVINKPGANGAFAAKEVAQSRPDGYTLLTMQTTTMFAELMRLHNDSYQSVNSFEHLTVIGISDSYIYGNAKTVEGGIEQVIEDTRTGRKNYSWATNSAGATLFVRQIEERVGRPINIVTYQGRPPALNDFLGGHVDIYVDSGLPPLTQQEQTGKVKLLASSDRQLAGKNSIDRVLPGIALPSFTGISMPAGANANVVKYYQDILNEILKDAEIQEKLRFLMLRPSNETLKNLVAQNIRQFKPIADKQIGN